MKLVSATIFDIGVYLVVIGLVIDVLRSLGSEVDRRSEADASARAEADRRRRASSKPQGAVSSETAGRSQS